MSHMRWIQNAPLWASEWGNGGAHVPRLSSSTSHMRGTLLTLCGNFMFNASTWGQCNILVRSSVNSMRIFRALLRHTIEFIFVAKWFNLDCLERERDNVNFSSLHWYVKKTLRIIWDVLLDYGMIGWKKTLEDIEKHLGCWVQWRSKRVWYGLVCWRPYRL